jgi:hypothetical protein
MGGGKGGGSSASSDIHVESESESTSTVDIVGLDDINTDLDATITLNLPQPLRTEASNVIELKPVDADLDTTTRLTVDPLKTDSSFSVDVKPAVVDLCLTANVGKLPNICVRQPYHHHIGITMFGYEVFGVSYSGEQQTVIDELDRRPQVAWGGATAAWPPAGAAAPAPPERPTRDVGGLRVRLTP